MYYGSIALLATSTTVTHIQEKCLFYHGTSFYCGETRILGIGRMSMRAQIVEVSSPKNVLA